MPSRASRHPTAARQHLWWGANGQPFQWASFPFADVSRSLVNRLPGHREICTKTRLAVNLREYAAKHLRKGGEDGRAFFPLTFVVHAGRRTPELDAFKRAAAGPSGTSNASEKEARTRGVWIVKPGASNRGRGIEVFDSVPAVEKHLAAQEYGSQWIVQKYIEKPILVHGRKFDIRQFALVDPEGAVYVYRDSYVRTCSAAYDVNNLDDKAIHLTNDAVQKVLDSYGEHEDANKLDFDEFQAALDADHASGAQRKVDFENDVWPAMVEAVTHVFNATLDG